MKNAFLIILFFCLVFTFTFACRSRSSSDGDSSTSSSDGSGGIDVFGTSDQTTEAIDLINSANTDLKKIKEIYKENENGIQLLTAAMNEKDTEKVKTIADGLVDEINKGMELGKSAVEKIEEARGLKVNETFREYLQLKEQALGKQLEAFELRRQAGVKIRDAYGEKDKLKIKLAIAELKENEEKFKALMAEARDKSVEANKIRKESLQKSA